MGCTQEAKTTYLCRSQQFTVHRLSTKGSLSEAGSLKPHWDPREIFPKTFSMSTWSSTRLDIESIKANRLPFRLGLVALPENLHLATTQKVLRNARVVCAGATLRAQRPRTTMYCVSTTMGKCK